MTVADTVRVSLAPPSRESAGAAAATVLRAPTGRLPDKVRGRDELLAQLRLLVERPDGRTHLLAGLGGTGKSTVALQLVEEAVASGRPAWWVTVADVNAVTAALMDLARALGATRGEVTEALAGRGNPADLLWRFLEADSGWLLVFDNVDDLDMLTVSGLRASEGAGWIRPTTEGLVLVTSRVGDARSWGRHIEAHVVDCLDAAEGAQVLVDLAPGAGMAGDAVKLSARLGGLPLALHHAGLHLSSDFAALRTFNGYHDALDDRFGDLMRQGSAANDRAIVTSTWELSLDALEQKGRSQARPLLRVLSCLAPAVPIPPALLDLTVLGRCCGDGPDEAAQGLDALSSAGLISTSATTADARPGAIIHPLVAETTRLRLDGEDPGQAGGVVVALLAAATAGLNHEHPGDWPTFLELLPHLNAVYSYLADRLTLEDLAALARVTATTALALLWAGSYLASEELVRAALQHSARLGADHEDMLSLRHRAASAYRFRGNHAQAVDEFRSVLIDRRRVLGLDHPDTLATQHAIATVHAVREEYDQAEQEYRDVLAARQRLLGPDHLDTLTTRQAIGRTFAARGQLEQAEQEFRDVLAARQRILSPDHPDTLATRWAIATVHAAQGQHEQAEREFRHILDANLRILGTEHPHSLTARHAIAGVLAAQGQYEQAEQEYRDVLADRQRVLGPDHPDTLTTVKALAAVLPAESSGQRGNAG